MSLIITVKKINLLKPFSQINKYATTKFITINGLAKRFGISDKSVQGWRFLSKAKQKWIESLKIFEISIEEMDDT